MKKWMYALTVLMLITVLSGCGSKKPSEAAIKEDIQAHMCDGFEEYKVQECKIVNSSIGNKGYYAEVEYTAKKAFVEGKSSARLYYQKNSSGKWVLDDALVGEPATKMVALPTENEILSGADGLMRPLEDFLYFNRLFNNSVVSDVRVLNVEFSSENHVRADISWVDNHDGLSGQMYGSIEISFFMSGSLQTKLLAASHGIMDLSNLNGRLATYESYGYDLIIESCTSEKLVLSMGGNRYEYVRDYQNDEYLATRFHYVSSGENIYYYKSIGWGGVGRSISRICLKTREFDNKQEYGDVILELSEGNGYADVFVVQNG